MSDMRKSWTDERLDDMNRRMEEGFNRVDAELRALRLETKSEIDGLRGDVNALQRTMLQTSAVTIAALTGLIAMQL